MAEGFKGSDHPETKPMDSQGGEEMETEENVESSSSGTSAETKPLDSQGCEEVETEENVESSSSGTSERRSERSRRTPDSGDSNQASAPPVSEERKASTSSEESKPISHRTRSKSSLDYQRLGNDSKGSGAKSKGLVQKLTGLFKRPETKRRGEAMETEENFESSSSGGRSERSFRTPSSGDSSQASAPPVSEKIKAATSPDESKPISQRTRSKSVDPKRQSEVSGSPLKEASAVAKGSPKASGVKIKNPIQSLTDGIKNLVSRKTSRRRDEARQSLPQSEFVSSDYDTAGPSTEVGEAPQPLPEAGRKPLHFDVTGQQGEFLHGAPGTPSHGSPSEEMTTDTSLAPSMDLCDTEDPFQSDPSSQASSPKEKTAECKTPEKELDQPRSQDSSLKEKTAECKTPEKELDQPRSSKRGSGKGLKRTKSIPEETDDEMACSSPSKRPERQDPDQGNAKDS